MMSHRPPPSRDPDPLPPAIRPPSTAAPKPKLFDQVRHALRLRHYSLRTEEAYLQWIRRFIVYHGKRHPNDMGALRGHRKIPVGQPRRRVP